MSEEQLRRAARLYAAEILGAQEQIPIAEHIGIDPFGAESEVVLGEWQRICDRLRREAGGA